VLTELGEMRQTSVDEPVRRPVSAHGLLSDTRHHLTDVDGGPLGPALGHDQGTVPPVELAQAHLPGFLPDLVQLPGDLRLRNRERAYLRRAS
jgi:hypothetical protein